MSAAQASSSTAPSTTAAASSTAASKAAPAQLLPLEEDDEFEEFPAEDWDESQTFAATLGGAKSSTSTSTGDKNDGKQGLDSLWEDNWDDDDINDDFSVQLRGELIKQDQMQA